MKILGEVGIISLNKKNIENGEIIGISMAKDANRIPDQAIFLKLYEEGDEGRQRNKRIYTYKHLRPVYAKA
jgi:hypothetical protein